MRGQVSVDFMLAVTIALIFFVVLAYSAQTRLNTAREVMLSMDGRRISEKLALRMNDILLAGDGSIGNVTLPELLYGGRNYTIRVHPHSVLITYQNDERHDVSSKILAYEVNGSPTTLEVNPGLIQIRNIGGSIYLENI